MPAQHTLTAPAPGHDRLADCDQLHNKQCSALSCVAVPHWHTANTPPSALSSPLHTPQVGDLNVLLDKLVTIANSWKEEEAGVRRRVSEEQAVVVRELMQVGAWFVGAGFGWGIVLQIMRR